MSMTEIAQASGFSSLRRFNEVFRDLFHRPPSALRRRSLASRSSAETGIVLRVRYRPPYDWESMLTFLQARAIPGVEVVEKGCYRRTVEIGGSVGNITVTHLPQRQSLSVTIHFPTVQSLPAIVNRARRLFDLGADIETIDEHLSHDPQLAPWVALRPGLRAPGGWDGFELAVRAILGQQISVAAARRLAGQLVALHGEPLPGNSGNHPGLTRTFPSAERLAAAASIGLGMPTPRLNALRALARAAVNDPNLFRPLATIEEAIARLRAIPGIGEWTAQYIALRAIREMDAFPASDIGLLSGVAKVDGAPATPASLLRRAESWRPWRAYAAQHLWAANTTQIASVEGTYA
jgi:AraC family transcriptional regulator of adaptative response / DNA-3-methyladenine glycosylase II